MVFADQSAASAPTAKEAFRKDIAPAGAAIRGICAPKGLSPEVLTKLENGIKGICEDPDFIAETKKLKLDIGFKTPKKLKELSLRPPN